MFRTVLGTGSLIACLALIPAPSASASEHWVTPTSSFDGDTNPCATHREVWLTGNPRLTRPQLEKRWETSGKGVERMLPATGDTWLYPVCGRHDQYAAAAFTKAGRLAYVGIYTPDG